MIGTIEGMTVSETSFREAVLWVVRAIPRGEVFSYAEVAKRARYPGSARAVGSLMRRNVDASVPCHRVIRSDGRLGEYNRGGEEAKAKQLVSEGVRVEERVMKQGKRVWYVAYETTTHYYGR